ncbi:glycosyltransferase family 2 protein [Rhodobacteraceae bacterium NNCM2]|nr:glycosyltransferase family 2 protein [Coraliihabitans acroporae]
MVAGTVALIPAHNEVLTVREVVDGALVHVDHVIVIDDGSTDGTTEALAGSGARVIRHERNRGKGARLVEGFDFAFGEGAARVITLDADRQHDPGDIPAFLAASEARPDALIIGDRSADLAEAPPSRARGIRFGNFFIGWACECRVADAQCGMRLYPASMWRRTRVPPRLATGFLFETAVLLYAAEAGVRFVFVPIRARYAGFVLRPSHFDPIRDFLRLFGLVTRFLASRFFRPRGLLIALGVARKNKGDFQSRRTPD